MAARSSHRVSMVQREAVDWRAVVSQVAVSRALDDLEETTLLPQRKVLYQFSARGHDVTQVLLGWPAHRVQGCGGRLLPLPALAPRLGLSIDQALASTMMRAGSVSEGRDIGVVFNLPRRDGACALPVCGGVGTQYTPAVGWAQALRYRRVTLGESDCAGCIAVAHGGDASTATNGFWSALNIATTERLPLLFFIEDNGYGISVPTQVQTPGGNIARNLSGFRGLRVLDGDGSDPMAAAELHPGCGRGCPLGRGTRAAAARGSAAFRTLGPGYADVQGVGGDRRGARARSVGEASRPARAAAHDRGRVGRAGGTLARGRGRCARRASSR